MYIYQAKTLLLPELGHGVRLVAVDYKVRFRIPWTTKVIARPLLARPFRPLSMV